MGEDLGRAAIDFMHDQVAPRLAPGRTLRYAVAHVDDAYGRAVAAGAAAEVLRRNLPLTADIAYPAQGADYAATAARIAAIHPDVLFVAAYLDDGVALRRATVAAGVHLLASIGTSSSYCHPAFGAALGRDAVGLFASDKPDGQVVRSDALRPEGRRTLAWARSRYRALYHEDMSSYALSGFANTYALLAHVLPAAPDGGARAVATAALRVKLPAGTLANGGGLDLAPPGSADAGANRASSSVIWEWVAPGTRAVVWPPAYATHPIVAAPIT
jgi:ABC-type branched-subunit amino acid transport system substrate-binding protein